MIMLPKWYLIAKDEYGVKELEPGINLRIVEYHSVTTLKATDDAVPWCSSFVSWCLEKAGIESTRSARARDYLNWGYPMDKPTLGCIAILDRGEGRGHVGFFIDDFRNSILLLDGNSSNMVRVTEHSKTKVLGYRWPKV